MPVFTLLDPSNDVHATALAIAWQMAQKVSVDSKDPARARAQLVKELADIMLGKTTGPALEKRTAGPSK